MLAFLYLKQTYKSQSSLNLKLLHSQSHKHNAMYKQKIEQYLKESVISIATLFIGNP